jgi:chemotaxis protein methyltransferase CheR
VDEQTFDQVKQFIQDQYLIDITRYKRQQMLRRLDAWLRRSKFNNWSDYFQRVRVDGMEEDRFRNYLTINVTAFFRDPERWDTFEKEIIPQLLVARDGSSLKHNHSLKIWSAGCSIGAEPYTLAMILARQTPFSKHDILATDFDRGALKIAQDGGPFIMDDVKNISPENLKKYFQREENHFLVKDTLKEAIRFQEQDMLSDQFENRFDLIVCRNVVIYFTREIKEDLYRKFHNSLAKDGILFLGGTEIIPQSRSQGFLNIGGSVYKKIDI